MPGLMNWKVDALKNQVSQACETFQINHRAKETFNAEWSNKTPLESEILDY